MQLSKAGEISYYEDEDKEKKNEATFRFSLSGYTVSEGLYQFIIDVNIGSILLLHLIYLIIDANAAENARNRSIAKWVCKNLFFLNHHYYINIFHIHICIYLFIQIVWHYRSKCHPICKE